MKTFDDVNDVANGKVAKEVDVAAEMTNEMNSSTDLSQFYSSYFDCSFDRVNPPWNERKSHLVAFSMYYWMNFANLRHYKQQKLAQVFR